MLAILILFHQICKNEINRHSSIYNQGRLQALKSAWSIIKRLERWCDPTGAHVVFPNGCITVGILKRSIFCGLHQVGHTSSRGQRGNCPLKIIACPKIFNQKLQIWREWNAELKFKGIFPRQKNSSYMLEHCNFLPQSFKPMNLQSRCRCVLVILNRPSVSGRSGYNSAQSI